MPLFPFSLLCLFNSLSLSFLSLALASLSLSSLAVSFRLFFYRVVLGVAQTSAHAHGCSLCSLLPRLRARTEPVSVAFALSKVRTLPLHSTRARAL